GVSLEIESPGSISDALTEGGMPAAVMAIMDQLPFGVLFAIGFLLVSIVFVATTTDTMSYTVAAELTGDVQSKRWLRVFRAVIFGTTSIIILTVVEESITSIQTSIVITAVRVSILLLPPLWMAPKVAKKMALDQRLIWVRTG